MFLAALATRLDRVESTSARSPLRTPAPVPTGAEFHAWRPSRRGLLFGAAALVALTGCSDGSSKPSGGPPDVEPDDPDRPILDAVRAEKVALLRDYDTALAERPELAEELAPLRAAHETHLDRLGRPAIDAGPSPSPTSVRGRAAVLRRLAAVEREAANRRVAQSQDLRSGALARLVAGIGGAEAAHASLLRESAGEQ